MSSRWPEVMTSLDQKFLFLILTDNFTKCISNHVVHDSSFSSAQTTTVHEYLTSNSWHMTTEVKLERKHNKIRFWYFIIYVTAVCLCIWVFEYLSIWVFEYLSIWVFEYLSIWVFEYLFIYYLFMCKFIYLFIYYLLFMRLFIYLFVYLFICLLVYLFIYLFIYLLVYLFIYLFIVYLFKDHLFIYLFIY
jgi:hypothetical protein